MPSAKGVALVFVAFVLGISAYHLLKPYLPERDY